MSTKTLKHLVIELIASGKFTFPQHLTNGELNGEVILSRLEIVETQYFSTNTSLQEVTQQFTYAIQMGYGSNIIDMAKELVYRAKVDEEQLIGRIFQCMKEEGVMSEPEPQPFLKGTPALPRGCTGEGTTKAVEDIKRHFASFRNMKNKPATRKTRMRAMLSLLCTRQFQQKELLETILPKRTVDILGTCVNGWKDLETLFKDMYNDVCCKQNANVKATKEMHTAMKEMHNQSKPIHFLGRDHYQAEVMPTPTNGSQAAGFVWALYDAPYSNDEDRKCAFQRVLSYIHRLSADHQHHVLKSMNIKEKDPRQAGLIVTKLLQDRILGIREEEKPTKATVEVDTPKAHIQIDFHPEYSGYPFSKENPILKDPEEAVTKFFKFFQDGIDDTNNMLLNIKMVCAFFELASYEVKVAVLTRVFCINYTSLTPSQIGQNIVNLTHEWLYKGWHLKQQGKRNTFDNQNLENTKMQEQPTTSTINGDCIDMSAELTRMFINGGMHVSRPQVSTMPRDINMYCGLMATKTPTQLEFDAKIVNLVNAQIALMDPFETIEQEAIVRDMLAKKAMETYKPKLGVKDLPSQMVYQFQGQDVNGKGFITVTLRYCPSKTNAVYEYRHTSGNHGGTIAHIKCTPECAVSILEELKHAWKNGDHDMKRIVHKSAQLVGCKIIC